MESGLIILVVTVIYVWLEIVFVLQKLVAVRRMGRWNVLPVITVTISAKMELGKIIIVLQEQFVWRGAAVAWR